MSLLTAFDRQHRRHEAAQVGRTYRVASHDEPACMEGTCGGIIDEGELTYLGSSLSYHDRLMGDIFDHDFLQAGAIRTFNDDHYSLSLELPAEREHSGQP